MAPLGRSQQLGLCWEPGAASAWQPRAGATSTACPVGGCGARGWDDSGLIQADLKLKAVHN